MKREEKTFNKGNWSGEEATIYFHGSTWGQLGYRFWLTPTAKEAGEPVVYAIHGSGWRPEDELGKVYESAGRWYAEAFDLTRDDADPRVAAAQLLFNTV